MANHKRIPDQLRSACELFITGMTWQAIADELGRSVHTVRRWPQRYPGMWHGYMASEFNTARNRAVNSAVCAARYIIHNGEDKYRVPTIGHMLRYSAMTDRAYIDARRYHVDPNKEILENYQKNREDYERDLVDNRAKRQASAAARNVVSPEPAANASTKSNGLQSVMIGLLIGLAIGSAARGVANEAQAVANVASNICVAQLGLWTKQTTSPESVALDHHIPPRRSEYQEPASRAMDSHPIAALNPIVGAVAVWTPKESNRGAFAALDSFELKVQCGERGDCRLPIALTG